MGRLIRSAPRRVRDTDAGFYGAGCPNAGIECMVAQINKLLMHYGCPNNDGLELKVSLKYLIVELGITNKPLQANFEKYNRWTIACWLSFNDLPLELPHEGDTWLMKKIIDAGFSPHNL